MLYACKAIVLTFVSFAPLHLPVRVCIFTYFYHVCMCSPPSSGLSSLAFERLSVRSL
jgi:hypothetical protein